MDRHTLLHEVIKEASRWVGAYEIKGKKSDSEIDLFRKAVDGHADGEAWCCAFVHFCVKRVMDRSDFKSPLFPTELCLTLWQKTPKEYRISEPRPGCLIVWNKSNTIYGHVGIVKSLNTDRTLNTIEGNTSDPDKPKSNIRGVFEKTRNRTSMDDLVVLGYLLPF